MKPYKYSYTVILACCLWSTLATAQLNKSYGDSIKKWKSDIDTLLQEDDNFEVDLMQSKLPYDSLHLKYDHLENDLTKIISHWSQLFCGGGTAYFFEATRKKVVKISYEFICGRYWVKKNIYFNEGEIFFSKVESHDNKINKNYEWEEYYKDGMLILTTNKTEQIEKLKKEINSNSLNEGYKLLYDFKHEVKTSANSGG